MCGIAGILNFNQKSTTVKSLPLLLDTIKHRGPDDEGYVFFSKEAFSTHYGSDTPEQVQSSTTAYAPKLDRSDIPDDARLALGHRRLSIVDLSELGHQPMCDETGTYWLVFNGEIYNFRELKSALSQLGRQFNSNSDTEVLLKAYMEWGPDCLNKLNGMWAFAIYDSVKNTVFAARDRFGVKPFYYTANSDYFAFASEMKALLALPAFKREINPEAAFDYLCMGKCELGTESFFKGIFELKPAHYLSIDLNTQKYFEQSYYDFKYTTSWGKYTKPNFEAHAFEINNRLIEAIKLRLNADVKVGTCLSGGIDSSIIACAVNEHLKSNSKDELQELFTAVYPNQAINEEKWAATIAQNTKSNWNVTKPTAEQLKNQLEDLIYYQDIPFTSTSSYSQYKVMELVAQSGVKTTLDGQGADEMFGGYHPHFESSLANSLCAMDFGCYKNNKNNGPVTRVRNSWIKHQLLLWIPGIYKKQLLRAQPILMHLNSTLWRDHEQRLKAKSIDYNGNLNIRLANDYNGPTLKHILRLADRNSMRFSIESRMPFADDMELTAYAFNVPGCFKIRNGKTKYLLREAFKNLVPAVILDRKDKVGFATPEQDWLRELKPFFKEIVFAQESDEFIDWKGIQNNFEHYYHDAVEVNPQRLWRFINFALWRKCYNI